uniref:Uncharacterized protein n=1 Tax=Oryza rufipogon TaxID=4529 RepID=A0A0E0R845_ORYRU
MEATDDESNPAAYEQWRWGRASMGEGGGRQESDRPTADAPLSTRHRRSTVVGGSASPSPIAPSAVARRAVAELRRTASAPPRAATPPGAPDEVENPKPALARGSAPRRRDAGRYFFIASTISEPSNARSLAGSSLPVRLFAAPPLLAGLLVTAVLACGLRHTNPLSLNVVTLPSASAWELEMPAESRDGETKIPWLAGLLALTAMRPCRCHIAGEVPLLLGSRALLLLLLAS